MSEVEVKHRPTVPERLRDLAKINQERGALYGDNYKHTGKVLAGLFPRGLKCETEEEWNRLHFVMHFVNKLTRYCQNHEKNGTGHTDSLDDLAVYAMLAAETDSEFEDLRKRRTEIKEPSPGMARVIENGDPELRPVVYGYPNDQVRVSVDLPDDTSETRIFKLKDIMKL